MEIGGKFKDPTRFSSQISEGDSMTLERQSRIINNSGKDIGLSNEVSPEMAQILDGNQSALTVALYRSLID
ncbi:hypothetical protein [Sporohalobacter salinus]|uniref:hypothetical protein n=1 Tax=Sporohalobacter salinus TaxID=1494606 RepID=UPI00195F8966|nr:hypothetical protein [Sporohalobacter salinus]MBM7624555.1 hypothetical protein [Sporohalobacter salinus]